MSKKVALVRLTNQGDYSLIPRDTNDDRIIEMWLKGNKSANTVEAYRRDIALFQSVLGKPIQAVNYPDMQSFEDYLEANISKQSSRVRTINAVKSLYTFCMESGYIRINPAVMVKPHKVTGNLAARIMNEEQVLRMFDRETDTRNRIILRLLYEAALRVSELCSLTWSSIQPNATTGGQVTVTGKGDKIRSVPISKTLYAMLLALRPDDADYDTPVFTTRQGDKAISRVQVFKIVRDAATRAEVPGHVSPHWLRHAHASHALERGATIVLVKDTLGHSNISVTNAYAHARPSESSSTYLVTAK